MTPKGLSAFLMYPLLLFFLIDSAGGLGDPILGIWAEGVQRSDPLVAKCLEQVKNDTSCQKNNIGVTDKCADLGDRILENCVKKNCPQKDEFCAVYALKETKDKLESECKDKCKYNLLQCNCTKSKIVGGKLLGIWTEGVSRPPLAVKCLSKLKSDKSGCEPMVGVTDMCMDLGVHILQNCVKKHCPEKSEFCAVYALPETQKKLETECKDKCKYNHLQCDICKKKTPSAAMSMKGSISWLTITLSIFVSGIGM